MVKEAIIEADTKEVAEKILSAAKDADNEADLLVMKFLEGDYFGWYLDVWNEQIGEAVSKLAKTLSEYEPATLEYGRGFSRIPLLLC